MRRLAGLAFAATLLVVAAAHIGSPNVVFDGNAGRYPVRVIVRPPEVVPGRAEVIVRVNAPDAARVEIRPVFWRVGIGGAPAGDEIHRVAGQERTYAGQLWLMAYGAYSVYVTVTGARGSGTAIVPVNSLATGRLPISRGLGAILVVLGLLLAVGFVTIIRAAAGESLIPPGETFDPARRRRANIRAAVFVPMLALAIFGGAKWWGLEDTSYRRNMYGAPAADPAFDVGDGHRTLRLKVHDTAAFLSIYSPVAPDHGKMMHLFLVSMPGMENFAHLHPTETDSLVFAGEVPGLPAGDYRLFGDITTENGLSLTTTNTLHLPDVRGTVAPSDSDDTWTTSAVATRLGPGAKATLTGDYTIEWSGAPAISSREVADLKFTVRDSTGAVATLQPYLGMIAHAVVMRDDASVFIHLHPMGTVSIAGQEIFRARDRGDTTPSGRLRPAVVQGDMTSMSGSGAFSFPYEFPKSGRYRIWVQVKLAGEVLTAPFDLDVR